MKIVDLLKFYKKRNTAPERTDLYLRHVGCGTFVHYEMRSSATKKVEWVSMETDEDGKPVFMREPEENTREYRRKASFCVAGKTYRNLKHFLKKQNDEWAEDIYGRTVLCVDERYPCFDFYDQMYEHRYFHWYIIREGNSISRVFVADDGEKIYVTDDVQNIEHNVWRCMEETGFCQRPKEVLPDA